MSSGMGGDADPEPGARDGIREVLHQEANASEGATVIVAGRDVTITYAYGVRHRRRTEPGSRVPQCPYPGLAAFGPEHERWFFGRDRLVAELITRLDQRLRTGGMQMVVAPSGAGKTSLLRAGLLPRLGQGALERSGQWPKLVLTPTAEPMRALAAGIAALTGGEADEVAVALASDPVQVLARLPQQGQGRGRGRGRGRSRVVLVVDQFEELFTLCSDEQQRAAFIEVLARVAGGRNSVTRVANGTDNTNGRGSATRITDGRDSASRAAGSRASAAGSRGSATAGATAGATASATAGVTVGATAGATPGATAGARPDSADGAAASTRADAGTGEPPAALVVLGLRADFYAGCVGHPPLRAALEDSPLVVGPMSETELREAILYPAQDVGLEIEPGLEELLLHELGTPWPAPGDGSGGHEAGRLPLLAHALRSCWQQRSGHTLTVQGYQDTGGIRNAVATTANEVYRALDETGRRLARSVFLRLVRIGDGTEDTRRRVPRAELIRSSADGPRAALVVEAFTTARLLTTHLESVEITHESLLHSWPLLRDWIDEDRAGRLVHQHLEDAAEAWRRSGHDPSLLYGGSRLDAAESWAATAPPGEPGPVARDFLAAARRARRRRARLRTGITAVLAVLALLATIGAVAAFQQRGTARSQQHEAERQRDLVLYNQVLATADRLRSTDVSVAAQFTLIAHRLHPSGDTYSRLVTAGNAPLSMPVAAHRAGTCGLAASPDGRTLATGSNDYTVRLWDITDATRPKALGEPLAGFGSAVCALAFSPDGRTLVTGGFDRTVRLWNVAEPARPKPLGSPLPGYDTSTGSVRAVAFSPDGRTLATGSYPRSLVAPITDPGLRLWDVSDPAGPRLLSQAVEGAEFVDRLAFTPDGRGLVSSPAGKSFRMWDLSDLKRPKALDAAPPGDSDAVSALAMSPDGKTVVTGSGDQTLRVWDVSDPGRVKALGSRPVTGLTRGVESLAFSRDGRTLAAGCGDLTIRLWNLSDRASPAALGPPLAGHTNGIQALAFTPDGRTLVAGDKGRTLRLWSLPARPLTGRTLGYSEADLIYALAFSPNGHTLASGHFDKTVHWWNVTAPDRPAPLASPSSSHTYRVCAVEFSPDGRTAATGSGDRTVVLWDVSDPKRPKALRRLTGHDSDVCALGFSPDGRTLATGSRESLGGSSKGALRLWDVSAPDRPAPLGQPLIDVTGGITALAFSPDGHTLAASGGDSRVRLWDVSERSQAAPLGDPLSDHTSTVGGLAFSPDGRLLASSGADAVRLRDVSDPKRPRALATLTSDQGSADNVIFSPDGRTVAVSEDKTIRLWDVSDPRRAASRGELLDGHTGRISALVFSPDGRTLASAGSDQVIRLWNMDPGQDMKRICAVTRNTPAAEAWRRHVSTAIAFPAPC